MALSTDLISQFVKVTNDEVDTKTETTVYGTVVLVNGIKFVKIDGSEVLTPISSTADAKENERVTVTIKDHSATITGNTSSPAARVEDVSENHKKITELDNVMAYRITTENLQAINATIDSLKAKVAKFSEMSSVYAEIETLQAKYATLDKVSATDVKAINAEIDSIQAKFGTFTSVTTEDLKAMNADVAILKGHSAEFTYVSSERLTAVVADIKELDTKKLSAEQADLKYANIDFSNIGKSAMEYFYANSGLIENVTVDNGTITGNLVGVTIKGDLIEGNTVIADKLVIKGTNGLYYKLNADGITTEAEQTDYNSLNGSIIKAHSITATKISVGDLVAFDATIGGFNITNNSLYSGVKESVDNTTNGVYLDSTGQMAIGNANNFIKYYQDTDGTYKLEISANNILIGSSKKNIETVLNDVDQKIGDIKVGGRNLLRNTSNPNGYEHLVSGAQSYGDIYEDAEKGNVFEQATTGTEECYIVSSRTKSVDQNSEYTFSCDLYVNEYVKSVEVFWLSDTRDDPKTGASQVNTTNKLITVPVINEWFHFIWTFTTKQDDYTGFIRLNNNGSTMSGKNAILRVTNLKLEKGNKATDWTPAPEDVDEKIDDTNVELHETIAEQNTAITQTCGEIIMQALMSYTETGDFNEFKKTTESQLSLLSNQMTLKFTETSERLENINEALQEQLNTITKYFTFDINGLTIGQADNPYKVIIDNDRYSMTANGSEVMWIANGKVYTPEIEVAKGFKLFGYLIDQDTAGNVNCEYVGGEQ